MNPALRTPQAEQSRREFDADVVWFPFELTGVESVFSNLEGQIRLEQHPAKTPAGLALRIAQRLVALTLAIFLNTLAGRPARALAAYDGR